MASPPPPPDYARAITASLFSSPPGTNAQPNESFIAYVQTFETVPGQPGRKARFLIASAARDGRLKLHKAKQNGNGTFSIGKTWPLEELRAAEVIKRHVEGMSSPQPLTFVLHFAGAKQYRYDTEMPSSLQAAFLVTVVRCWRRYMQGRGQPDLNLVGFQVDTAPGPEPASSSRSRPSHPTQPPPQHAAPAAVSSRPPAPAASSSSRPVTAGSNYTSSSRTIPPSVSQRSVGSSAPPPLQDPSPAPRKPSFPRSASPNAPPPRPPTASSQRSSGPPPQERERDRERERQRNPSTTSTHSQSGAATAASNVNLASGLGIGMGISKPRKGSGSGPAGLADERVGPKERSRKMSGPSSSSSSAAAAAAKDSSATAAASTAGLKPTPTSRRPSVEEAVDDDTVMSNVEEMLEGFEWRGGMSGSGSGSAGRSSGLGKADEIEKRLVGELKALEAASIHAIMESDDRVTTVVKHLDDALAELDKLEGMFGMYKTQLNLMTDDIAHIEGQNRGLQVQTSNQRILLAELDKLMSTINIPEADLAALSQESLESPQGIERLEKAAVSLYKALVSTRDTAVGDMAAASEHVAEYRAKASQFAKRIFDFLTIMFKFQVDQILNPKVPASAASKSKLPSHDTMEDFLGRYCGLMLFVKEIDQPRYQQICAAYFTAIGDLHRKEVHEFMTTLKGQVKKASEDELEASFGSVKESPTLRQQSMRRAGTLVRSPLEGGKKDKDGKVSGSEAFGRALSELVPHILREQGFVSDFLHINSVDQSITFADYMVLEAFFRRGATTYLMSQQSKLKDVKSAMDVIFNFFEAELREWIDQVLAKDSMQIVGVLAALDRFILQGEKERNEFLTKTLQKQYQRSSAALDRACKEQVKSIEQTKLTLKKRKGVAPFVRVFPLFVSRVEAQLAGADDLPIRDIVNSNYERIVSAILDCLQQMAKMGGEGGGQGGEGKDQLNYHVVLIENMHHIMSVFAKQRVPVLASFVSQAREKYTQNLDAYIRLVLRRPLARVLDFFTGLEQLLRTTPPTEVSLHAAYTKQSVRRVLNDLRAKDLRKAVEQLYKRVDKHFGAEPGQMTMTPTPSEGGEVLKTVWTACEDETQRLVAGWRGLIDKCYPDDKVGLEFGKAEVHEYFVKAQSA